LRLSSGSRQEMWEGGKSREDKCADPIGTKSDGRIYEVIAQTEQ